MTSSTFKSQIKKSLTILATVTALISAPALLAQTATTTSNPAATALVQKLLKGQATIVQQFPAISNLIGFVLQPTKAQPGTTAPKSIVYADKDGKYLVAGNVIGSDGQSINSKNMQQYVYAAQAPKILIQARATHWVTQGDPNAPHKIYVMVEPNCLICHMLYQQLEPLIQTKQIAVRWIFVAFMRPTSQGQVAAIFQAKDPIATFKQNEATFDSKKELGGVKPLDKAAITAATQQYIANNQKFMMTNQLMSTPVIIFQDSNGKAQVIRGMTRDPKALKTKLDTAIDKF